MSRITQSQVAPLRAKILAAQTGRCALCDQPPAAAVLDHCHRMGYIRGVLCRGCNAMLGHIENNAARHLLTDKVKLGTFLSRVVPYLTGYEKFKDARPIHYTFRTPAERKLAAKVRKEHAKKKPTGVLCY